MSGANYYRMRISICRIKQIFVIESVVEVLGAIAARLHNYYALGPAILDSIEIRLPILHANITQLVQS